MESNLHDKIELYMSTRTRNLIYFCISDLFQSRLYNDRSSLGNKHEDDWILVGAIKFNAFCARNVIFRLHKTNQYSWQPRFDFNNESTSSTTEKKVCTSNGHASKFVLNELYFALRCCVPLSHLIIVSKQ
jgi:hypothetical protein